MNRIANIAIASLFAASLCAAPVAFADSGDSGRAEEPAVSIAPEDATSAHEVERFQQSVDGVEVSAEGDSALIEGLDFGISDFSRASAGSNRKIDDVYHGFNYYVGSSPENVSVVGTSSFAIVYIPSSTLGRFGLSLDSEDDVSVIEDYLIALDAVHAKGSVRLETIGEWHFTSEQRYSLGGISYSFDEEVTEGRYYTCIIGEDGMDVTNSAHPSYARFEFADFARIVPADEVQIVAEKAGLDWLADFLANLDYAPLWVTLKTTGVAIVLIFALGLAAAYFTMRIPDRARDAFDAIFTIPMVLPPTVCGFLLLLALGRNSSVGQWFIDIGFPLIFSWPATVIAAVVVAFPLMYRNSRGAFESLDANMLDAARTLGWSDARIFFKLMLPLSWSSIAAATALAFARALGEFGATLFLAGNHPGITQTIPLAIYFQWMNGNIDVAVFWTIVIMVFSFMVILAINIWSKRTTKYRDRKLEG